MMILTIKMLLLSFLQKFLLKYRHYMAPWQFLGNEVSINRTTGFGLRSQF
ncbi:MAG: hypothetical protein VKL41_01275 [Snowella sp.]|nr:hypothetical protein [Snowella sp.]